MSRFPVLSAVQIEASKHIEEQREDACRRVRCPVCEVRPGTGCLYAGVGYGVIAHTGRYRLAAAMGLVPRLVGDRG